MTANNVQSPEFDLLLPHMVCMCCIDIVLILYVLILFVLMLVLCINVCEY